MAEDLIVGIIQARRGKTWRQSLENVISILDRGRRLLEQVDVLFFSENWLSRKPLSSEDLFYALETIGSFVPVFFAGAMYVAEGDDIVKSVGYLFNNGNIKRVCEKLFPSRAVGERERIKSGLYFGPVQVRGWKISCIACVDIFYPEISRLHTIDGADVIYNPASIPMDRINLWHSILLTRASENTVFTIGVNGTGYVYPDGRITLGNSIVYAANGIELARHGKHEGIISTVIDRRVTESIRRRWAFYDDLRELKEFYSQLKERIGEK